MIRIYELNCVSLCVCKVIAKVYDCNFFMCAIYLGVFYIQIIFLHALQYDLVTQLLNPFFFLMETTISDLIKITSPLDWLHFIICTFTNEEVMNEN